MTVTTACTLPAKPSSEGAAASVKITVLPLRNFRITGPSQDKEKSLRALTAGSV